MKIQTNTIWLSLSVMLVTGALATLSSGCAGDREHQSTGEYIDDKSIHSRVTDALSDNNEYKFDGVKVDSFKGTVQLSGFVDTYAQKSRAGDITKHVQGVRAVENNITVKSDLGRSTGEYVDDKSLTSRVNRTLANNPEYKFDQVIVTVDKGTVQLSGFVNTVDQKTEAGNLASGVQGVKQVDNNITVKDSLN